MERCLVCKPGYFLDPSSNCVKCPQNGGCAQCDPGQPQQCILCATMHFMTPSGECLAYNHMAEDPTFSSRGYAGTLMMLFLLILA